MFHTTPLNKPGSCPLCASQAELGRKLPHTTHLALAYGNANLKAAKWLDDFQAAFGVRIALLDQDEATLLMDDLNRLGNARPDAMVYRLNEADFLREDAPHGTGLGFHFMANAAPVARQLLQAQGIETVNQGDVLHFEGMAHLSTGAERLGVLKAVEFLLDVYGDATAGAQFAGRVRLARAWPGQGL